MAHAGRQPAQSALSGRINRAQEEPLILSGTNNPRLFFSVLLTLVLFPGCAVREQTHLAPGLEYSQRPLIIAHRGASGYLPEHTLQAYDLAIRQGAHFIETDLVITRDGVLIARHENELSGTTDVAEKYPERMRTRLVDGQAVSGWFSEDFTLAEIKTLGATQRFSFRDRSNDGKFQIPTFDEVLRLVSSRGRELGRGIGIYPETKHPSYFALRGLGLEEPLVAALQKRGLDRADAPVFIQSFEIASLKKLNELTAAPLIQLVGAATMAPFDQELAGTGVTYSDLLTDAGLRDIAAYADGIGPSKALVVPRDREGTLGPPTDLVTRAHAAGLLVHAYTFRSENRYLAEQYDGDPHAEYHQFFRLGIDGVFTDFPDTAISALQDLAAAQP